MHQYITYLLTIILILISIRFLWKRRKIYKCGLMLKGPFAWPLIGNALWCIGNSEEILKNLDILFGKYGTPYRFWLGSKLIIAISKPEDLQIMLNSYKCIKKDESLMYFFTPFLGNGLITAQPKIWKPHRKHLNPAFNQKIINTFIPAFNEHTSILINNLRENCGRIIDINKYISLNTLDFICDTTMGIKMNAQIQETNYSEALNRLLKCIFERIFHIWSHLDHVFNATKKGKQFAQDLKIVHEFAFDVLKQKKLKNQFKDDKRKSLLDYMLDFFTDKEIFDEINTFMAAGTDTISSVISFVCMILGSHPDIQEHVFNEIQNLRSDELSQMNYLERIINETMRLFPPVPLLIRKTTDDIILDTCTIPKNVIIAQINMYTHRDPKIWPNPLDFNPDRFLQEEKIKRHPYSFLPFGGGVRNCIGMRYAMVAMKITLSMLIKKFRFHSNCDIKTIRIENGVVLRPVAGHLVQLELR